MVSFWVPALDVAPSLSSRSSWSSATKKENQAPFCMDDTDLPTYYKAIPFEILFFLSVRFLLMPYSVDERDRIKFQFDSI